MCTGDILHGDIQIKAGLPAYGQKPMAFEVTRHCALSGTKHEGRQGRHPCQARAEELAGQAPHELLQGAAVRPVCAGPRHQDPADHASHCGLLRRAGVLSGGSYHDCHVVSMRAPSMAEH